MGATQPQSAHSSHATTPRSARPGTMGSLLEVPPTSFGAIGQPAAPKYPSQGSLDGELPGYMKPAPGARAPIGRGSKTSQVTPYSSKDAAHMPCVQTDPDGWSIICCVLHMACMSCDVGLQPQLCHNRVPSVLLKLAPFMRAHLVSCFSLVQNEVPSSVRAFWETGTSHPGGLSTSISLDSAKAPGEAATLTVSLRLERGHHH